jgi:uncharacterized protein (DUF433 family)
MLMLEPETYPLKSDSSGTIYVADTRVTLDTLIQFFKDGSTAEQIAMRFPALRLSDVYAVITYYLRHQNEVEGHLAERLKQAKELQHDIERQFDSSGIRERLLTR